VGANEEILAIDIYEGKIQGKMIGPEDFHETATILAIAKSRSVLAVGYSDGSVLIYDTTNYNLLQRFSFHSGAITSLCFDKDVFFTISILIKEYVLFSGSKDTSIIAYDLIASSSLFKLTRHKDLISSLVYYDFGYFSDDPALAKYQNLKVLISASKDSLIKMWDITGQYSIDTQLGFTGGVTGLTIAGNLLIATSDFDSIKVYELKPKENKEGSTSTFTFLQEKGEFKKTSKERTIMIKYYKPKKTLLILSIDGTLELFKKNNRQEIAKRMLKSRKRKIEKAKLEENKSSKLEQLKSELETYKEELPAKIKAGEYDIKYVFSQIGNQALGNKARAFYVWRKSGVTTEEFRAIIGYSTNSLELWSVKKAENQTEEDALLKTGENTKIGMLEMTKIQEIGFWGHKSPIRLCIVSGNDELLLTASNESVKIWNISSLQITKNIQLENIVCGTFLPGDKYAILGSKEGYIYIVDSISLEILHKIEVFFAWELLLGS